jgi:hypothetical protein
MYLEKSTDSPRGIKNVWQAKNMDKETHLHGYARTETVGK